MRGLSALNDSYCSPPPPYMRMHTFPFPQNPFIDTALPAARLVRLPRTPAGVAIIAHRVEPCYADAGPLMEGGNGVSARALMEGGNGTSWRAPL